MYWHISNVDPCSRGYKLTIRLLIGTAHAESLSSPNHEKDVCERRTVSR